MQSKWTLRFITALIWALAAASVVYWGLRASGPGPAVVAPEAVALASSGDALARQTAIARLLGATKTVATASAAPIASRFSLIGVVTQGHGGAALLAVDGKPARPYRVGSRIDEGMVLQSVGPRHVVLAASVDGAVLQRLEMPSPASTAGSAKRAPATPPPSDNGQTE